MPMGIQVFSPPDQAAGPGPTSLAPSKLPLPASAAANCAAAAAAAEPAPAKMYISYNMVHESIVGSLGQLQATGWAAPDYLIAISGGGLIPARILRSVLRAGAKSGGGGLKTKGSCAEIKVIGLELYDDEEDGRPRETGVVRTQWLERHSTRLAGKRILIVDEVDDSRQTLEYAVRELQADIAAEEAALRAAGEPVPETQLGVYCIYNKLRPKLGTLPDSVARFVAQELGCNPWCVFPWDAWDIAEHTCKCDQ